VCACMCTYADVDSVDGVSLPVKITDLVGFGLFKGMRYSLRGTVSGFLVRNAAHPKCNFLAKASY